MKNSNEIVYSRDGKRDCIGRVDFSIAWHAAEDSESAEIWLNNLDQPAKKHFRQFVGANETSVEFYNGSHKSFISVWLKWNDLGLMELYLSYPVDSDTIYDGVIAEWRSAIAPPPSVPIIERQYPESSYSNIAIDEWEAIFPFLCLGNLPTNELISGLDSNRYIQVDNLSSLTIYKELTANPATLKNLAASQKVVMAFVSGDQFIGSFESLGSIFSPLPKFLDPLNLLSADATEADVVDLITGIAQRQVELKSIVDSQSSKAFLNRCWSSVIALMLSENKAIKFQCLLLDMIAALRVHYFLAAIYFHDTPVEESMEEEVLDSINDGDDKIEANSLEEAMVVENSIKPSWRLILDAVIVIPDNVIPHANLLSSTDKSKDTGWCRFAGIGDVRTVYQKSKSYALGDIAKITNIVAGEKKNYSYESIESTRDETIYEIERLDNKSTQKVNHLVSELNNEVKNIIANDEQDLDASGLTPSYDNLGLVINGTSDTVWLETMSDELLAQQYARNITDRASENVKNKVADLRLNRQSTEIRQCSTTEINNSEKEKSVNAIYRWVDLVHHFEIRPGNRALIMEFLISEPAKDFIDSLSDYKNIPIIQPTDDSLFSDASNYKEITSTNYKMYQAKFDAHELPTPPPAMMQISVEKSNREGSVISGSISVPDGYTVKAGSKLSTVVSDESKLFTGYVGDTDNISHSNTKSQMALDILYQQQELKNSSTELILAETSAIGSPQQKDTTDATPTLPIPTPTKIEIPDPIPAIYSDTFDAGDNTEINFAFVCHAAQFSVDISILCEADTTPTSDYPQLLDSWQQDVFRKLQSAYQQQVAEYNKEYEVRLQQASKGRTRAVERKNLTTEALKIMTTALNDDSPATLRFLERSLLWDEMAYQFFPWESGKKPEFPLWYGQRTLPENNDKLFDAFLKAGSARVLIPINPRLITDALLTLLFNQVWDVLPSKSIMSGSGALIMQALSKPLDEEPNCDGHRLPSCWSKRIPTAHTYLQESGDLPRFDEIDPR